MFPLGHPLSHIHIHPEGTQSQHVAEAGGQLFIKEEGEGSEASNRNRTSPLARLREDASPRVAGWPAQGLLTRSRLRTQGFVFERFAY